MLKQLWMRMLKRTATGAVLAAASPALPEREPCEGQRHGEGDSGNDGFDRHLHRAVVSRVRLERGRQVQVTREIDLREALFVVWRHSWS
jgi:hypothetical protein